MRDISIKGKLLLLILISIVICFSILGFYNTKNSYEAQDNLVKNQTISVVKENSKFIDAFLQSKMSIITAIVEELQDVEINATNDAVINKFKLAKKAGEFVDVYIGFEKDGSLVLSDKTILNIEKDNYDARTRPWYKDAVSSNKVGVSNPYVDVSTKKLVVTIYAPLIQNGSLVGVVGSDIFIDTIVDTILNITFEGDGLAYLINAQENIIIHKNSDMLNKEDTVYTQIKTTNAESFGEINQNNRDILVSYGTISTTNWKLILQLDKNSIYSEINAKVLKEIILYLVLLLFILGILFYALLKILAPLKTLEEGFNYFFKYLKSEETHIKKINLQTNDEFGKMAHTLNSEMELVASTINQDNELVNNVKEVVSIVRNGKLNTQVTKSTTNKSLNELKNVINDMIDTINKNVNSDINPILLQLDEYAQLDFRKNIPNPDGNVSRGLNNLCDIINKMLQENKLNGELLSKNSNTLLHNVDILNKATNETAVSLEETAAALEEITSTVISNTAKISDMASHSKELTSAITQGQKLANSTVVSMDEINEQTQAIAEAITVIDQIAFQTNILSLNAAVEAATAGEAGKGFAVVAQEVRNLASRSAEAAKEIKELVENATQKTNNGKNIADKMIQGYSLLNENIAKTTSIIQDITQSSSEQRQSIEQINDVVNRLDQQTQNNASVSSQTHNIAVQTSKIAKDILNAVNEKKFKEK